MWFEKHNILRISLKIDVEKYNILRIALKIDVESHSILRAALKLHFEMQFGLMIAPIEYTMQYADQKR